jgi:acyl-CoA reductase-like NAD-dependent aldehyde dehydrogenase
MNAEAFLVAGRERHGPDRLEVSNPFDGRTIGVVASASAEDLDDAIDAASTAVPAMRRVPAWRRAEVLRDAASRIAAEREAFARTIALEAGKPVVSARVEVDRAVLTLRTAAEEALRIEGSVLPLDCASGMEGRVGLVRRFPVGAVALITPFNFPLNLVAHKVAPALAAGCPFVLKPASKTPLSALALAHVLLEAGAPPEAVSVLPVPAHAARALVEDDRIKALSFTGSPDVGWDLRRRAGRKKVVLELGGNAGVIVDATADCDLAVLRIAAGGYAHAGQSCVSVQRVYVHRSLHDRFLAALAARVATLRVGDPLDDATDVGPLISEDEARRVEGWIAAAASAGATIVIGGARDGSVVAPAILTGAPRDSAVCAREAFAPLVVVEAFDAIDDAIAAVDDSDYGLQAGLFTNDLSAAWAAFGRIEVGALIVNDVPTWRADPMPYGGVKASGTGREGPRWAIEDFTEPRMLVLAPPADRRG